MKHVGTRVRERLSHLRECMVPGLVALATVPVALVLAAPASAAVGALAQKAGINACISQDGTDGFPSFTPGVCADGVALDGARSVTVSPDGRNAYVVSQDSNAVALFDRNATTGALTRKPGTAGCISETGAGPCTDGVALSGADWVTVSPNGKSAYVTSFGSDAVAVFDRNTTTGVLTQKPGVAGCVSEDGTGGACINGVALNGAGSPTLSPDGKSAYVTSGTSDAVAVFDRNATTGALTQKPGAAGCISETGTGGACTNGVALDGAYSVTLSPDGKHAYVASSISDAVAVFDRNTATGALTQKAGAAGCISETGGACTNGAALNAPYSVTLSPDGKSAYVASDLSRAVAVFDRNTTTGVLTQKPGVAGCVSEDGTGGACTDGVALLNADSVTVSPDGTSAYVAGGSGNVAVFDRNTATGALTQKAGAAACISIGRDPCAPGVALFGATSIALSPDGTSAYVASFLSDAVAVFNRTAVDVAVDGSASAKKSQKQRGSRILVTAEVEAGEDLAAKGSGKVRLGKRSYKLKSVTNSLSSGDSKNLKLKPKKKDAKKIAKALKKGKKAKAKLTVKLTDEAGNKKAEKLSVKLKR